jgi:DNA-binding winged helix-turn-helix (wHTH) protein
MQQWQSGYASYLALLSAEQAYNQAVITSFRPRPIAMPTPPRSFRLWAAAGGTAPIFSTAELLARLQVAQRHAQPAAEETVFTSGPLTVDLASRSVKVNGQPVKLTRTEYALLRLFVRNAGKVLTHPQIMESVWGPGHRDKTHYLHVYMTHLREKIETTPAKPELLVTEPRVGYRLNIESPVAAWSWIGRQSKGYELKK